MMKRAFDVVISAGGLLLLAPVMLVVALAIKLTSPGPVLYAQDRVGRHGRLFRIYKFRSMVVNADQLGSSVTTGDDRRITRVGKFLRRTKLDELPQLWNVLSGDMSLVGPRPDVPEIVEGYTSEMRRILEVRPGITSIASLHLRNEEQILALARDPDLAYIEIVVPAKVRLAMQHVDRPSLWSDLQVLFKTVWALTGGRLASDEEHPIIKELRLHIDQRNGLSGSAAGGASA